MIFSKRLKLAKEVDEFMAEKKIMQQTFGVVCALSIMGYLRDKPMGGVGVSSECNTMLAREDVNDEADVKNVGDGNKFIMLKPMKLDTSYILPLNANGKPEKEPYTNHYLEERKRINKMNGY